MTHICGRPTRSSFPYTDLKPPVMLMTSLSIVSHHQERGAVKSIRACRISLFASLAIASKNSSNSNKLNSCQRKFKDSNMYEFVYSFSVRFSTQSLIISII